MATLTDNNAADDKICRAVWLKVVRSVHWLSFVAGDGKGVRQLAAFADANAAQTGLTPCQGTAFPDRSN
ncbi:MAG: hypothetical protein Q4D16_08225 [Eubacteriales bacterium]|nr:hypothetical protein [Eubacteriales bacterium]